MNIHHALVLNLHQPPGNLQALLQTQPWETREILLAMDRIPRVLWGHEDLARVHVAFSGTLLETLASPEFQSQVYGTVDCGRLIWHFQNRELFRVLGTGFYHPVLPLIPEADRDEQIERWLGIGRHLFWRRDFQGFWPPEMGFCMELIPQLKRSGYRYVLVDCEHVEAITPMNWQELRYRPHVARYGGEEIVVVVRDRDLSNAQESGMEVDWFTTEIAARTQHCDFPPLVTTATDGDNGGWFRNWEPQANFWGFYLQLLERARADATPVRPTFIDDYLDAHGTYGEVRVHTGAWNTGWHNGHGFVQWTGSQRQKDALARVAETSEAVREARRKATALAVPDGDLPEMLEEAMWHLLRAETSCNFFWGEAWVDRAHADLDATWESLSRIRQRLEAARRGSAIAQ